MLEQGYPAHARSSGSLQCTMARGVCALRALVVMMLSPGQILHEGVDMMTILAMYNIIF
jgi:hypothetical protein